MCQRLAIGDVLIAEESNLEEECNNSTASVVLCLPTTCRDLLGCGEHFRSGLYAQQKYKFLRMSRRLSDGRRSTRRRFSYTSILLLAGLVSCCYVIFYVPRLLPSKQSLQNDGRGADNSFDERINVRPESLANSEMFNPASVARQLGDQLTLAKAYVVMAKENSNYGLAWELSAQIRACQNLLSQSATSGTPVSFREAEPVMKALSALTIQAKDLHYDSATMIMKLKAQMQALEERANAATAQSTVFGQLAAEAVPKGLHCLGMRLTMVWATTGDLRAGVESRKQDTRLTDNNLYHLCVFSDNVLATSVVVNSTIQNADHPYQLVFHVVTDHMNYGAMQAWFALIDLHGAAIEVQNIDEFTWLNSSYVPVLKQLGDAETRSYYFKSGSTDTKGTLKFRNPKYLSMLNHLRFYIPEVYPALKKVVFLDDDVVVQRDLTALFSVDLSGNVNGAVETCLESFHRFHKYLNFSDPRISSHFDPESCGWAFGMNVFDLVAWKAANVTSRYHYWQEQNVDRTLWKLGTLPPGLLTFYGLTHSLDPRWHVLGLGYDANIDSQLIESGAVVHFNGNMKPWLKLAMSRYKPIWEKYVDFSFSYVQQCNIH